MAKGDEQRRERPQNRPQSPSDHAAAEERRLLEEASETLAAKGSRQGYTGGRGKGGKGGYVSGNGKGYGRGYGSSHRDFDRDFSRH